jgi:imidazoleglycerol-phosphate dehydratase
MLVTLGKHALFDLNVACKGDLHVDMHHTVEDTGIVLGQALDRALGDRAGIVRAGWSYFPLDEALARCVVDLSGRSYLVWQVEMDQSPRAPMDLTVLEGFFKAMCDHARFNLHVTLLAGRDFHHGCEAIFKAFARALRQACAVDPRAGGAVPSTKGVL